MSDRRAYNSPLRENQAEQTRALILDTLAEMIAEDGFEGIVVKDLAKRAGTAERTVYRHFPDRDALHDALADRMAERAGWNTHSLGVGQPEQWPEFIHWTYAEFDTEEVVSTVVARLNAIRHRSSADSGRRRELFRETVIESFPDLEDDEIEAVVAVLQVVGSSRTWLRLKEELGMSGQESGRAMRWVFDLVVRDLRRTGRVPRYDGTDPPS